MHCNCAHPAQESAFKIAQIPPFYRVGDGPKRIHGTQAEAAAPSASVIWCIPGACFCIQKMHCRASGDAQIPRFCIVRDDTSQRDVRTTHPSCPMDEGAGTTNGRPESTGPPSGTGSGAGIPSLARRASVRNHGRVATQARRASEGIFKPLISDHCAEYSSSAAGRESSGVWPKTTIENHAAPAPPRSVSGASATNPPGTFPPSRPRPADNRVASTSSAALSKASTVRRF